MSQRFVNSTGSSSLCLVFLIFLVWQLGVPAHAQAPAQSALNAKSTSSGGTGVSRASTQSDLASKKVLILHTLESSTPLSLETNRGLLDALRSGGIPGANLFFESMDLRRNPGPELRKLLVEQMRQKWSHRKADMVITVYPEALEFVLNDCRDVFPHVPIIALHLPQNFLMAETGRRIIGHFPTYDIAGTIDNALKLVPGIKRVYVVSGAHKVDKLLEDQARLASKKWKSVEFLYLSHMTIEDILAAVSKAPPDSVILYLALTQDVAGKSHTGLGLAHELSQVSTVPVFGLFESALGYGVTGGTLISWNLIGERAGQLVIDILKGFKTLDDVPPVLEVPSVPMFDWRQLRRWNLSEAALPKGSIVINRESTFWDFRYYLIGVLAFCLAESALIIYLIVQRRRKKVAEESLRKAEEKYRSIFEGAVEGILETSPQGQPLTVNPALARILGYDSPGEFIAVTRDFGGQVYADPEKRRELVDLLEKQDVVLGYECEFLRRNGEKIWVSINTRRICGPDGETLYYSAFIEDITERRRAGEALRGSEVKYRQLYESMMDGYVLVCMDGAIKEYNEAYLKMTGYVPEELLRLTYRDLTPEKWHAFEQKIVQEQVLIRGYSQIYEKEYCRKDGTVFPVELRSVLLKDETGANSGMWAILRDITERKQAEEALRESEKEAQRIARDALAMAEIGRIASSTLTIEDVYEPFATEVKKIIPFDRIVVSMIDGEKGTVRNVYITGAEVHDRETEKVYPLEGSGNAEMLRTKSTFLLQTEDFTDYRDRFPQLLSTFQAGFRSILNVPLISQGKVIGGLLFRSLTPYAYTDEGIRLAEMVG